MNEREIKKLAHELMLKHGLFNNDTTFKWTFKFNTRKKALGVCRVNRSDYRASVELSKFMIDTSPESVKETLLHEIAHAIDNERNGYSSHGYNWQKIMRELGQEPERLASKEKSLEFRENIDFKYTSEKPCKCGKTFNINRLSSYAKKYNGNVHSCRVCKEPITWKQNY